MEENKNENLNEEVIADEVNTIQEEKDIKRRSFKKAFCKRCKRQERR